jgi:signal transduction histidine kinase/CheY-like chemotaxis protein
MPAATEDRGVAPRDGARMAPIKLTHWFWVVVCTWTGVVVVSGAWNAWRIQCETRALALTELRTHLEQERAFNLWSVGLGGLYAPVTEATLPNPLLEGMPDRDITVSPSKQLTLLCPHVMIPQLGGGQLGREGIRHHLASLNPKDPARSPDVWERTALTAFAEGQTEHSEFVEIDGRRVLRLMQPLITEPGCLPCHGPQGYNVGDIRGGLEAWTDMGSYNQEVRNDRVAVAKTHGLFWLLGLIGIRVATRRIRRSMAERDRVEAERRKLEARVQQVEKLESLGVLAGGVAHEFNNLLTGMLGHTSLALEALPAESPVCDLLQKTQREVQRAAELTRHMLALSGKGRFVVEPIDLNRLIADMGGLLGVTLPKGVHLSYNFAAHAPCAEADAGQLRQIVMSLVMNASEALANESGVITIATGTVAYDPADLSEPWLPAELPAGTYACLDVADTGSGMDAATLDKIFDPFFTTKFAGRGLGLPAVLGIVRGHRGAINVRSEVGLGTTVRVLLPRSERTVEARPAPPAPSATRRPGAGTVLIADDDPAILEAASMSLDRLGFRVLTARDGCEALDVFRQHGPEIDAVLLDLTMPCLDGAGAFHELRRLRADVPVILTSGYSEHEIRRRYTDTHQAGFIQKPYLPSALAAKLRDALRAPAGASTEP